MHTYKFFCEICRKDQTQEENSLPSNVSCAEQAKSESRLRAATVDFFSSIGWWKQCLSQSDHGIEVAKLHQLLFVFGSDVPNFHWRSIDFTNYNYTYHMPGNPVFFSIAWMLKKYADVVRPPCKEGMNNKSALIPPAGKLEKAQN